MTITVSFRNILSRGLFSGTRVRYLTYFGHDRTGVLTGKHRPWHGEEYYEVSRDTVDTDRRDGVWVPVSALENIS